MSTTKKVSQIVVLISCLAWALWLTGCASTGKPVEGSCKPDIEWQVTAKARIIQLDCEIGTYMEKRSLIFTVEIKNITDKPLRYRVNIFLQDLDKAAGYLVPRKGKPPVLEPGNTKTVKIPFIKTTDIPKKVLVAIETTGY